MAGCLTVTFPERRDDFVQSGRNGLRSGPRGLGFTLAHCPGLALRASAWPPVCPVFPQCILNLIYSLSSLPGCRSSTPPAPIFYFLTPSFHFLALFLETAWWEIRRSPKRLRVSSVAWRDSAQARRDKAAEPLGAGSSARSHWTQCLARLSKSIPRTALGATNYCHLCFSRSSYLPLPPPPFFSDKETQTRGNED